MGTPVMPSPSMGTQTPDQNPLQSAQEGSTSEDNLVNSMTNMIVEENALEANVQSVKTQDDSLGTLLDIKA